ncbi:nucleotide-binding universal stress UspA family protein [Streptosporangium album]|uniref:Nucleotide-binding universal stress UspA family protein n=1 Tax=Streptosporangium album TaxID=47479 RepID=A0A7W7WE46_9ACTN|nr:universal stress protein [Streptosporangium album]MBB4942989.1 nucleotide-binding universal stress UspA family protein [Streptosporangium album]
MAGHVLVGTDGSRPAAIAVKWAAEDAVRRNCALRVVHVCETWAYDVPYLQVPEAPEGVSRSCEEMTDAAADAARAQAPGLAVTAALIPGRIIETLLAAAEQAVQVVVGSRGLGGFAGMLVGSVGMGLSGHTSCPLVVVRSDQDTVQAEIAVGFDGSEASQAALEYAFAEAARRGARLRVVHAWQVPYALGRSAPPQDLSGSGESAVREALKAWLERHPQVETAETTVQSHPVAALCDASAQADLVVVGSRGLGGFGAAVLGSVSRGVLLHAHCPVAVVPHPA